jgi:putative ABC transport system permease protein
LVESFPLLRHNTFSIGEAMQTWWQDLRYGLRVLLKKPGFTLIAVLTLSLGIGANTAIFSAVETIFLRPLPFSDAERLVYFSSSFPGSTRGGDNFSIPDFRDVAAQNRSFEAVAAYQDWVSVALGGTNEPVRVIANFVSSAWFDMLGARTQLGRSFTAAENSLPAGQPVVMLSHTFWQRQFGGDANIVGKQIHLNETPLVVIGVMSADFRDLEETWRPAVDVWLPLGQSDPLLRQDAINARGRRLFNGLAKLRPGVSVAQAQAELDRIAEQLAQTYPETDRGYGLHVRPLRDHFFSGFYNPVLLLLVGSGFVLLIGCANIASLLLAHTTARRGEFAVRAALGASRWRLMRQLLIECLALALAGGAAGLLLGLWVIDWLGRWDAIELPDFVRLELNPLVLAVALLLSLLTALLCALLPAWESTRVNLRDTLSQAGRAGGSLSRNLQRKALIVAEVSLSLLLLIGAGLTLKSFQKLISTGLGFPTENLLTLRMDLTAQRYAQPAARAQFGQQLVEKAAVLPGVESAALWGPGEPGRATWVLFTAPEGRAAQRQEDWLMVHRHNSHPGALRSLGITLLRGRDFSPHDTAAAPRVAIISESLARKHWPNEDAVGKRLQLQGRNDLTTVIGVAADVLHRPRFSPHAGAEAFGPQYNAYLAYAQAPHQRLVLAVRMKADPASVTAAVRQAISALDPSLPLYDIKTLDDRLREQEAPSRAVATLLSVYGLLAMLQATLGLYGVLAQAVSQRTGELGLRMALGAQPAHILRLIIGQGLRLIVSGIVIGLAAALVLTRFLSGLLFGVSATDPLTFVLITLLLALVALLACWLPARRATKVDPLIALRYE